MIGLAVWLALTAQAGVPAVDSAITPVKPLAAARAAAPLEDTCDEPVLLVISGQARDSAQMQSYAKAVAESGLYQQLGGYQINSAGPQDILEGDVPVGYANQIVRFPCRANAVAFWNSKIYQQQIKPLRTGQAAADLIVAIYRQAPVRADMVGKVGDDSYSAAFSTAGIAQIAPKKP